MGPVDPGPFATTPAEAGYLLRETVQEDAVLLALPVDVRAGGHAGHTDHRDDLAPGHRTTHFRVERGCVVVAGLKTIAMFHADLQPTDQIPSGPADDAVFG